MRWQDELLKQCYEILYTTGEVRITFTKRKTNEGIKVIPIIKIYPENQIICDEEVFKVDD